MPLENATIYRELSGFRVEVLLYMMAVTRNEAVQKAISYYFTYLRQVTTSIRGRDLQRIGIQPGPIYRDILDATLNAKLNGRIKTRSDELNFARSYVG
jgi:tRNA nucleotidyltransferase (CCA-adding enzyme)